MEADQVAQIELILVQDLQALTLLHTFLTLTTMILVVGDHLIPHLDLLEAEVEIEDWYEHSVT